MKASIVFFPNKAKKSQRTGKIPLYMRICFKGGKAGCQLSVEITEMEFLKWDPITMRFSERNNPLNHYLNRLDQKLLDFTIQNATSMPQFNAATIKDFVPGNDQKSQKTVFQFIDEYYKNAVASNVDRSAGTIKTYRRSVISIVLKFQK